MLKHGVLKFGANGDIIGVQTPAPIIFFNGGTPTDAAGDLVVAPFPGGFTIKSYVNGLGYEDGGAVVTDALGDITHWTPGGLPMTADGLATAPSVAPDHFIGGLPVSSTGRLCVTWP